MTRTTALRWILAGGTVAAAIVAAPNTHTHAQDATDDCAIEGRDAGPDTDLYCIELFHRPDFPAASGRAELGRVPSPYGTRVSTDRHHEFDVAVIIRGLPDPSSIGPYTTYVAWATTPLLRPMVNLGPVGNGRADLGRVGFDKFLILITTEASADGAALVPYGRERATHALMGRFGNLLLVNGEPEYRLAVDRGAVVRFLLTNVSNTRTFNLSFGDATIKLVAADVGKFERETWVDSVVIAPAERYIVEVRFPAAGAVALINGVQSIDHVYGNFFPEATALGQILVRETPAQPDHTTSFDTLRAHGDVVADIDRYRGDFDRPVDHRLLLTLAVEGLPYPLETLLNLDSIFFNPVEWSGTMPRMNWVTTTDQVQWILRDEDTGHENLAIDWSFRIGDRVKVRLRNDRTAVHAMQHPIHIHGQRFLVLAQDGVANDNLVWKARCSFRWGRPPISCSSCRIRDAGCYIVTSLSISNRV